MWGITIILQKVLEYLKLKTVIGFLVTDITRALLLKRMWIYLSEGPLTLPLPYTILIQIPYIILSLIHNCL